MNKNYSTFDIASDNIFTKSNNKIINNYKKNRFVLTKILHKFFLDNKYEQKNAIILKDSDNKFGFGYNENEDGLEIKNINNVKFVVVPNGTFFYNTVVTLPETNVSIDIVADANCCLIFRQNKLYFDFESNLKENDIILYKIKIQNNKIIPQINNSTKNFYESKILYCKSVTAKKITTDVLNVGGLIAIKTTANNSTINNLKVEPDKYSDSNKNIFILSTLADNYIKLSTNGLSINKNKNVPIGTILPCILNTEQNLQTYLLCDGSTLNKDEYSELFNVIGYTYGGSDNEFNLPDLRELTLVGAGKNETYDIASHDVYEVGDFKDDQIQNHTHNSDTFNHYYRDDGWSDDEPNIWNTSDKQTTTNTVDASTDNKVRTGTTTHGKQFGVNFFIKAYN